MSFALFVNEVFYFYSLLIIIRIFLTWIPTIDWNKQPVKAIREVTDAYLDIFRRVVPPFGGLDFSPIIAIIVLQIVQTFVVSLVRAFLG
ncbi:MAG: YggT family protein [bacterium]|nr:YggT family protein [bacterium]